MIWIKIFLSALFFAGWTLFQSWFINKVSLLNKDTYSQQKLIFFFPIIVPIVASVFVFIFSSIWFRTSPLVLTRLAVDTFKTDYKFLIIIVCASLCLSISYSLYPFIIEKSISYAAFITISITIILLIAYFKLELKQGEIKIIDFKFQDNKLKIIGAFLSIIGLGLMKYESIIALFKK